MKKHFFLKSLIALVLLSTMLVSAFLGVTKAEYFKSLSKKLGFEVTPDLALQYYLVDGNGEGQTGQNTATTYTPKFGVYKDAKNILQPIAVGRKDPENIGGYNYYLGDSIVYQIKIPVKEAGYYTLDFTVDFLFGVTNEPYQSDLNKYGYNDKGLHVTTSDEYHYKHPDNEYFDDSVFSQSYQYCMGCEVLNAADSIKFGDNTPLNMANRISKTNEDKDWAYEKHIMPIREITRFISGRHLHQLAPKR